jgi:5-(carboxyamino)imidazole ribonucleotide mutase
MKNSIRNGPKVSIVMGSQTDWKTLVETHQILKDFNVTHEKRIISAHRTPERLFDYSKNIYDTGVRVIIAGAGGAAHLPGMIASLTHIPVLGVPIESKALKGIDSLLSIVQMPYGIPLPTLAIGKAGAQNAALAAISILSINDPFLEKKLISFRVKQTRSINKSPK